MEKGKTPVQVGNRRAFLEPRPVNPLIGMFPEVSGLRPGWGEFLGALECEETDSPLDGDENRGVLQGDTQAVGGCEIHVDPGLQEKRHIARKTVEDSKPRRQVERSEERRVG